MKTSFQSSGFAAILLRKTSRNSQRKEAFANAKAMVMNMDIKAKITELVDKIKNDKSIAEKFQKDPIATVEGLLGIDLPDDQIKQIVDGVKAKVSLDNIGGAIGGLFGKK